VLAYAGLTGALGNIRQGGKSSSQPPNTVVGAPQLALNSDQQIVDCSGSSVTYPPITVSNTGSGQRALGWQASVTAGATVSPPSGSLRAGGSEALTLTQPGPATTATTLSVTSNGGYASIVFTCAATSIPLHGKLAATQTKLSLGDYCGDTFDSSAGIGATLSNSGTGPLTWSVADSAGYTVSPATDTLAAGVSETLGLTGTKANTTIKIQWQDGGKGTVNTLPIQTTCNARPHGILNVNPTTIPLGYCDDYFSNASFTLTNTGNQFLTWSVSVSDPYFPYTFTSTNGSLDPGVPFTVTLQGDGYSYNQNTSWAIQWQDGGQGTVNSIPMSSTCDTLPPPTSVSLSANSTSLSDGQPVTLTATASSAVDHTSYGIQIVDLTDGVMQIAWCVTGSTCTVTMPGKADVSIQYEAYIDQGDPYQWVATSPAITVTWYYPSPAISMQWAAPPVPIYAANSAPHAVSGALPRRLAVGP
jgi:hypothetical protein